jgi:hypothetical protein
MRKQQRGGFITALVVAAGNAIAAAGPRIAQIVAEQLPAIVGGLIGASRGVITQAPTTGREVVRTLRDLAGRNPQGGIAQGGIADVAVALSIAAVGTAGLAVATHGPRLIDSMLRGFADMTNPNVRGPTPGGPTPGSGISNAAANAAREAGDGLGEAVTKDMAAKAAERPPIPTGPLTPSFIKLMKPGDINAYFKANPGLKIPDGVDRSLFGIVRNPERVRAQLPAFFRTLALNGRIEGTPAEILTQASELLGDAEALRLLAPIANPAIEAQRISIEAERAHLNALPEGPDRFERIARRAAYILEEAAEREAEALTRAFEAPAESRLENMVNGFRNAYSALFGGHPEQLVRDLGLTGPELRGIFIGRLGQEGEVVNYNHWLPRARNFFASRMTGPERANYRHVMTPQIMSLFRQGMLRVFMYNPGEAEAIFEGFATHVIPAIANNGRGLFAAGRDNRQILATFLNTMRQNPAGARVALEELIQRLTNQAVQIQGAAGRTLGTLPIRLLQLAIRGLIGAAGTVGLFMVSFQGTPNGGGFPQGRAEGFRDLIYQWFGIQLWQAPPPDNTWGRQLATAGGFENVEAMTAWLATEGRRWLWNFMGAILAGLGFTAMGAARPIIAYFRGTPDETPITPQNPLTPPRENAPLTATELNNADTPATSGGFRSNRKTRRHR